MMRPTSDELIRPGWLHRLGGRRCGALLGAALLVLQLPTQTDGLTMACVRSRLSPEVHSVRLQRPRVVDVRMIDPSTFEPPPTAFPLTLEQPGEAAARAPAIAPLSMSEALLSVPTAIDGLAAAFIGVAFYLGADFALAPLGIAGRRPFGESVEAAIGEAICADEQWLRDRQASNGKRCRVE
eukprot:6213571-Pleurochrysis_carterae.AAC.2